MASRRRRLNVSEALELVLEDGSDTEIDVIFDEDDDRDPDYLSEVGSDDQSEVEGLIMNDEAGDDGDDNDTLNDNQNESVNIEPDQPNVIDSDQNNEDVRLYLDEEGAWTSEWVRDTANFPLNAPFTGEHGLRLPADFPDDPNPIDFYKLFVNRDLINLIKTETNRYARKVCSDKKASGTINNKPRSIFNTWKPVTQAEVISFLAILIHMGIVKKPKITDYWSKDASVHSTFASRLMKRDRFKSILAFFHLNNNELYIPAGNEGHDPLFKLRPLYDHLLAHFPAYYKPDENICIDEALCPWRGRSSMRVYMRDKPTKWGIKFYELCESFSGYVYNFEIYCRMPGLSNTPYDVCHRLMEPLRNEGYTLYVDNYYCNPALCESFAAENTQVVGTVRANRIGMPADLTMQPLRSGEWDYRRKNNTVCVKWKDKRDVYVLSTKHVPAMCEVQTRTERKEKPTCVADYTKFMAGVDKSDQMISYLPLYRKTIKWYKKLVFHFFTLIMIQSHCLYNKHKKQHEAKQMQLDAFVKSVCNGLALAANYMDQATGAGDADAAAEIMRLQPGDHWPQEIIIEDGDQTKKTRRGCKVCYAKLKHSGATRVQLKNKKHTSHQCETCKVPLCIVPCFRVFHTAQQYWK